MNYLTTLLLLLLVCLLLLLLSDRVSGHGYLKSPRSRNFVAFQDGVWWGADASHPRNENCPHCLNLGGTLARCGLTSDRNYDHPQNNFGDAMPWQTQDTYVSGSIIDIETVVTAHHKGHIEVKACPIQNPGLEVATQDCFDAHPLTFVSDELYGAPIDTNYPGRAYLAPPEITQVDDDPDGVSGSFYHFKFQLPDTLVSFGGGGQHVLLQWYYLTGNSCTARGYPDYPFLDATWYTQDLEECSSLPPDGMGVPEQFWNCAEIYITPSTGEEETKTTPSPMTPAPLPSSQRSAPTSTRNNNNPPTSSPSTTTGGISNSPKTAERSINHSPSVLDDKTIVGYYASWQQYDRGGLAKPINLDFSKVDRVNFAYFQTNEDGFLYGTDSWGDPLALFGPQNWMGTEHCSWDGPNQKACNNHDYDAGLIAMVHAAGGEIYPSIGGWTFSSNFPAVAASATARANFANQCVELIQEYDFDGIDIDWKYPGYVEHAGNLQDKENYNILLDEIRSKLDALEATTGRHYGLTAALPCGSSMKNIDVPHVASVLDEVLLTAYNLHGSWEPVTGVNAPLYYQGFGDLRLSIDSCVFRWQQAGAQPSQISVGLAFYGQSFAYSPGLNAPHSGLDTNNWRADGGVPQYFSIVEKMPTMTSVRHDVSKTPFAFFKNGGGFVSYDDERSICEKTEYVINHNLNGFLIWELSGDVLPDLSTPLLDIVNAKLSNPSLDCSLAAVRWVSPTTSAPTSASTSVPMPVPTHSPTSPAPTVNPTSTTLAPTAIGNGSRSPSCPNSYTGWMAVDSCSGYRYCWDGSFVTEKANCPNGKLFDEATLSCNHYYSVWCNDVPPPGVPLCPSSYSGWMAVNSCSGYRYCTNGKVTSSQYNCESGFLFDVRTASCNFADKVTCRSKNKKKNMKNDCPE